MSTLLSHEHINMSIK